MKINLFTISMVFFTTTLSISAQEVKVKLGPKIKFDKNKAWPELIHNDGEKSYLWSTTGVSMFSSKYGHVLDVVGKNLEIEKSVEFKVTESKTNTESAFWFKKHIIWITSQYDRKNEKIAYRAATIDLKGKQINAKSIATFAADSKKEIPITSYVLSRDSSRLLFIGENDRDARKDEYGAYLAVINDDVETIYSKKLQFKKSEKQVTLISKAINNKNEVYLLYKIYEDKVKESKKEKPAYDLELLHFVDGDTPAKKYELNLNGSFINSAALKFNEQNILYCAGMYSNTGNGPNHGVYSMQIKDGQVIQQTKRDFSNQDLELLGKDNTEKDKSGEEGLGDEFDYRSFNFANDGRAFLTLEPNYYRVYSSYNGRNWTTYTVYYSEDIVTVAINPDGEIDKISILPKNQSGDTPFYLGHTSIEQGDNIIYFYNEDIDNYKKPVGAKPRRTQKISDFVATLTILDKNGKYKREKLFDHDETDCILMPKQVCRIGPDKYFVIGFERKMFTSGRKYMFGEVTVK
jgi:hypothetical protein